MSESQFEWFCFISFCAVFAAWMNFASSMQEEAFEIAECAGELTPTTWHECALKQSQK